jgi:octaprenyl-diphosphate synthase
MKTTLYPKHLAQFRISLNQRLTNRVSQLELDSYFADEILKRIEKGRKIRSFLFITTAEELSSNLPESLLLDVCLSIEMSHAASVLVDDILDGDDVRHGYQSSQATLGTPASTLQAHFLCSEAITLVRSWPEIQNQLVDTYRRLSVGEMYDIFMPQPTDQWICNGYTERIYQKTSALFEYSLVAAALVAKRGDLKEQLRSIGQTLGKLYQLSNDYYDMQPHNLRKRHTTDHSWRITFFFPLAIFLQLHGLSSVQEELNQQLLSYDQWMKFLEKIWTKDVSEIAMAALTQTEKDAKELIESSMLPAEIRGQFTNLIELIVQEEFWYHSYDAQ